jgi:glucokinase
VKVVQIFVRDSEALLEVVNDIRPVMKPHHIVCCHSTVSLEAVKQAAEILADTGAIFLDAPFTGSKMAAEKGELTGHEVYQAIQEGDPGALRLLNELGSNLGLAVASFTAILDPEIVVIGGGVSAAGELLLEPIRTAYLEHLPARGFRPELKVVVAQLHNDAGVVGAADLARLHSLGR